VLSPVASGVAALTDVEVDVEADRVRTLMSFGSQCPRGTLDCDGATEVTASSERSVPAGAAGFDFSMTRDDAERRCRMGSQLWSSTTRESFECSGAVGVALPFRIDLMTCHDHVCRLVLSQHVAHDSMERFAEVEATLVEKYGATRYRDVAVPAECSAPQSLPECIHDGRAHLREAWKWDVGYTLTMTLEAPTGRHPFLIVAYSSPSFGELARTRGL